MVQFTKEQVSILVTIATNMIEQYSDRELPKNPTKFDIERVTYSKLESMEDTLSLLGRDLSEGISYHKF